MPAERRQRVLVVTRNLPPLVGGMERLNWHMAAELAKVADVRVVGPEGSAALAPEGVPVAEAPLKPLWKFLLHARRSARREARAWKPDLVLAGSGLTAPLARTAARTCGARTAVYVHGLDVAVPNRVYRALWLPAIRRADRVIANSHATADLCRGIGVDPARIGIVHPGVDLPGEATSPRELDSSGNEDDFEPLSPRERGRGEGTDSIRVADSREPTASSFPTPRSGEPESSSSTNAEVGSRTFRQRHNLANRPLLLSVGRLSARKGLREFVTQALPQIAAIHPDVVLLIVGDAPNDALHAQAQTPDDIRTAAAQLGLAGNIRFLGTITDYAELGTVYRACDVHVFPVREIPGDPEGFGMVAVEAAAHGLPTVAFATGGVPDAVIEGETGSLIQPGEYHAFADSVNAWLARYDRTTVAACCAAAAEQFGWQHFGEQLRALLGLPEPRARQREA